MLPDPLLMMQSGNLFVYTINNPVMFLDPSGHLLTTGGIIGGIYKGLKAIYGFFRVTVPAAGAVAVIQQQQQQNNGVPQVTHQAPPRAMTSAAPAPRVPASSAATVPMVRGAGSGLDWSNVSNRGESALSHVNRHATPNFQRANHGVFRGNPQTMVEQAWANRGSVNPIFDGMGGTIYNIPFHNAGFQSGYVNFGQQMNHITIIVQEGTSRIWSAFPSFGNHGM